MKLQLAALDVATRDLLASGKIETAAFAIAALELTGDITTEFVDAASSGALARGMWARMNNKDIGIIDAAHALGVDAERFRDWIDERTTGRNAPAANTHIDELARRVLPIPEWPLFEPVAH